MENEFKDTEIGKIPVDWEVLELKQVTENIFSGGTPDTRKPEYWNGDIPWLSSGETRNNSITETEKKITYKGVENSSTRLAKKEDIVIASAGQGYTRGQASFCKIDTYINQSIVALRTKKELVNPLFLYYNITLRYNELRAISDSHSSRGSLTTKLLAPLKIPIPPLEEQQKIAQILSALDDKIENNNQQNKILEETANSIFKEWFVDFNFLNEDGLSYLENDGEMEFNEELEIEIPEGWNVKYLDEICTVMGGGTPKTNVPEYWQDGTILWATPTDMTSKKSPVIDTTEKKITELGLKESSAKLVPKGSILMTSRATIGYSSIAMKEISTNQGFINIICDKKVSNYFILYLLEHIKDKIIALANGSTFLEISKTNFKNIRVIVPDYQTMEKYNEIIEELINKIYKNSKENQNLSNLRDLLLPKLMSGEIRLK
ncbi:restriction endonuclease subunit S [Methanococcus maripaludis]|uniref:Type I restriction enzyme S subunit n=2 Tax=Methanococcus maripaludis TaxID=39152 RepID=A0A7J9PET5_METMI|nr:restriction endonuclease subunit S [Methanococcus maripaludis]MBA2861775.1 type I restriction enzyme S subunit [Methanococcus maripaludis]